MLPSSCLALFNTIYFQEFEAGPAVKCIPGPVPYRRRLRNGEQATCWPDNTF